MAEKRVSIRQARAAIKMIENGGNASLAMRQAGYSSKTAHNPHKLTKSKVWEELLGETASDSRLNEVLDEGLKATTYRGRRKVDDFETRHKYFTTALKLRDKFPDERMKLLGDKDEPLQITITEERKVNE